MIARRQDVRGKTTCKTNRTVMTGITMTKRTARQPQDDRESKSEAQRTTRRRQTPAYLPETRARTKRRREMGEKLGSWFRVTKTDLYTKASPPRGGHSVATVGRRRGKGKANDCLQGDERGRTPGNDCGYCRRQQR